MRCYWISQPGATGARLSGCRFLSREFVGNGKSSLEWDKRCRTVFANTQSFVNKHVAIAQKLNKPLVIEEFGPPRDRHSFDIAASTKSRDEYYKFMFSIWLKNKTDNGVINGANF